MQHRPPTIALTALLASICGSLTALVGHALFVGRTPAVTNLPEQSTPASADLTAMLNRIESRLERVLSAQLDRQGSAEPPNPAQVRALTSDVVRLPALDRERAEEALALLDKVLGRLRAHETASRIRRDIPSKWPVIMQLTETDRANLTANTLHLPVAELVEMFGTPTSSKTKSNGSIWIYEHPTKAAWPYTLHARIQGGLVTSAYITPRGD